MKFFEPQVSLYVHTYIDGGEDQYFLHIATFTDNARLQANGATVDRSKLNTDNSIEVDLQINENVEVPFLQCVNPITHTIELGALEYNEDLTFVIKQTINATSGEYEASRPKPRAASPRPVIISRPIGKDSVEAAWEESFGSRLGVS